MGGWWQAWGNSVLPVLGSMIVSLTALFGVVWSTNRNNRELGNRELQRRTMDARHDLYLKIEEAALSLDGAIAKLLELIVTTARTPEEITAAFSEFDTAADSYGTNSAPMHLYASKAVWADYRRAHKATQEAAAKGVLFMIGVADVSENDLQHTLKEVHDAMTRTAETMRAELGSDQRVSATAF